MCLLLLLDVQGLKVTFFLWRKAMIPKLQIEQDYPQNGRNDKRTCLVWVLC